MNTYTNEEVQRTIHGYKKLGNPKSLSNLLNRISHCNNCRSNHRDRSDHPINSLVRSLPLDRLVSKEDIIKYVRRIKRDDTFLRNLLNKYRSYRTVLDKIGSAKFSIGLLPWLDRCMLYRAGKKTKLMVIGIDYKNFPAFHSNTKDHNFPLDSYRKPNNIWGPTWRRFWINLLDKRYDDTAVNDFIKSQGVYMTNSMLCFGRNKAPTGHFFKYLECCRDHIVDQIKIVRPKIIVSFGNFGCRNVASILSKENPDNPLLQGLTRLRSPLKELMKSLMSHNSGIKKKGINVKYNSSHMTFWPLYQPARNQRYDGDYKVLRKVIGVG